MRFSKTVKSILKKLVSPRFVKQYIRPFLLRRKHRPYDAKRFFTSYYKATLSREFSDGITVSPNYYPLFSRYHYNSVENSIIEYFASTRCPTEPQILDIGSGAGHWIDFYLGVFGAQSIVGVEISKPCADALRLKYKETGNVYILEADISSSNFNLRKKFDIINAIGVLFHIVDDELWRQAVRNIANHLSDNGVVVISGQFGSVTRDVQFHSTDTFSDWEEFQSAKSEVALVNKRVRSLRLWRECARQAGLQINCVQRTRQRKEIATPENNVLILSHASDGD